MGGEILPDDPFAGGESLPDDPFDEPHRSAPVPGNLFGGG